MISAAKEGPSNEAVPKPAERSPLAQLLHALNQPLTGLQCSLEVALSAPRTPEQYVLGLRQGLELTERMRRLVAAIREVADGEDESAHEGSGNLEIGQIERLLRLAVADFAPVAETNGVNIALVCSSPQNPLPDRGLVPSSAVHFSEAQMAGVLFRLLDWILSVAARGSWLRLASEPGPVGMSLRFEWQTSAASGEASGVELGLLVAEARLERAGARWERQRAQDAESLIVRLPSAAPCSEPVRMQK